MTFMRAVADMFRHAPKNDKPIDRYGLLSPLLATGEYVTSTTNMVQVIKTCQQMYLLKGKDRATNLYAEKSVKAYQDYVKHLSSREQQMERNETFSSVLAALDAISANLTKVEDDFQVLFGTVAGENPEKALKSSSLVVIGYLEKADNFCTWISALVEHLTAEADDMIPPYRSNEMLSKAATAAEFSSLNLNKWSPQRGGLIQEIKTLQVKGADLPIQAQTGEWIDEFAHDNQFDTDEKTLISASLRSPMLMIISRNHVRTQARIELLSARKEWLTAKLIQEQSKLRGVDVNSPEYRKLKKITEKYASLIGKYEQQIERMRG